MLERLSDSDLAAAQFAHQLIGPTVLLPLPPQQDKQFKRADGVDCSLHEGNGVILGIALLSHARLR